MKNVGKNAFSEISSLGGTIQNAQMPASSSDSETLSSVMHNNPYQAREAKGETLSDLLQRLTNDYEDEGLAWQLRLQEIQDNDELSPTEQIEAAMVMLVSASKGIEVGLILHFTS